MISFALFSRWAMLLILIRQNLVVLNLKQSKNFNPDIKKAKPESSVLCEYDLILTLINNHMFYSVKQGAAAQG